MFVRALLRSGSILENGEGFDLWDKCFSKNGLFIRVK